MTDFYLPSTIHHTTTTTAMNLIESLLCDDTSDVIVSTTEYKYGTYFMMRHNTSDVDAITNELPRIYNNLFKSLDNIVRPQRLKTTPNIPLDKFVKESIKLHCPLMVSTLELKKSAKGDVIISHHFVYGLHWYLQDTKADANFSSTLETFCKSLSTVSEKGNTFLIQSVGVNEEQAIDRNSDDTIISYIRHIKILDTQPDLEDLDDMPEDNLIMYFNKLPHPKMKYALHYSHAF